MGTGACSATASSNVQPLLNCQFRLNQTALTRVRIRVSQKAKYSGWLQPGAVNGAGVMTIVLSLKVARTDFENSVAAFTLVPKMLASNHASPIFFFSSDAVLRPCPRRIS